MISHTRKEKRMERAFRAKINTLKLVAHEYGEPIREKSNIGKPCIGKAYIGKQPAQLNTKE